MLSNNPLYAVSFLPDFARITPGHAEPALAARIAEAETAIAQIEADTTLTWDAVFTALHFATQPVSDTWTLVSHLHSVVNNEEWRSIHQQLEPRVVAFSMRVAQSQPLYERYAALETASKENRFQLTEAQQRVLASTLRGARHAGIGLPEEQRARVREIHTELAGLGADFSHHVLDAINNYSLWLREPGDVEGLPASLRQAAAIAARERGEPDATPEAGPWRITLDTAVSLPFLKHAASRQHRETLFRASTTKASTGDLDNSPLIDRILALRQELAQLLGYPTYAHLSCASKMARTPDAVDAMLTRLANVAVPRAKDEHQTLQNFARETGFTETLQPWDTAYYAERQRETRFNFSEEDLRPYLPLENALGGLFALCHQLFGIDIRPAAPDTDGGSPWHPDVRLFQISAAGDDVPAAYFYLDPYLRPGQKQPGAWMNIIRTRYRLPDGTIQPPVALMVCNQPLPTADAPCLMRFDDLTTLFHEFGHALQHLLTEELEPGASGINNVEWDAVELASQFMENWCYDPPTLRPLARHYQTGEPLPDALLNPLLATRTYRAASFMVRQLHFSATDLQLHLRQKELGPGFTVHDLCHGVAAQLLPLPPLPEDRFLCSFSHIFAGGYAAGYYSYKWAELLAADAFDAFVPALDPRDEKQLAAIGRRYRETILARGGGRDPLAVFRDFRGRDPDPDALLRHDGLLPR